MRPAILVVEDDEPIRTILAEALRDEGYTVHTARNGQQALDAVRSTTFAVLLIDLQMPVMDGWKLVRTLREQGCLIPVVIMTASRDAAKLKHELTVAAYVDKPFDLERLFAILARVTNGVS